MGDKVQWIGNDHEMWRAPVNFPFNQSIIETWNRIEIYRVLPPPKKTMKFSDDDIHYDIGVLPS